MPRAKSIHKRTKADPDRFGTLTQHQIKFRHFTHCKRWVRKFRATVRWSEVTCGNCLRRRHKVHWEKK